MGTDSQLERPFIINFIVDMVTKCNCMLRYDIEFNRD